MPAEGLYPSNALPGKTVATPRVDTAYLDADTLINQRDILRTVDQSWDDKDFVSFLELDSRIVKASRFYNYEQGLLFREARVATVTSASASGAIITLSADSYLTVQEITGAADRSPIKEGDIIPLTGDLWVRVNAKSGSGAGTTYTVQRVGTVGDVGAALILHRDNALPIVGQQNAFGEGTNMPTEGLDTPATRFQGQFQTIKSFAKITGDAASQEMVVSFGGTTYYWNKMTVEQLKRHRIYQNMALMFGPGGSVSDGSQNVTLTASLRSNLKTYGNQLYYNKNTGITLSLLDKLAAAIKQLGYTKALIFSGSNVRIGIEDLLRSFTVNGGIVYDSGSKNGQRMIDLGFGKFIYHGVEFELQEYRIHPILMGQSYMPYNDEAYVMPAGAQTITTMDSIHGASTISVPSMTLCYKVQSNGVNRRFIEVTQDMKVLAGMNDSIQKGLQSQEGLQQVGIRKGFFIAPASA